MMSKKSRRMWSTSLVLLGAIASCLAQGQDYVFTGPADTQFIPNYDPNRQEFNPFRPNTNFQQIDSYLPQRDLQTSDLPYHLQQTLPQYRVTTKSPPAFTYQPQFPFRSSQPAPFRPIVPSTHRPNYSHLFSHAHNRNPGQSETFLGEITLQSPPELPLPYNGLNQNLDNQVQIAGSRGNFLNHRTRIFAPDSGKKTSQVKNYFVNNNGDVFITTKTPFVPKITPTTSAPTTSARRNPFSPSTRGTSKPLAFNLKPDKKQFVPKNPVRSGFDLDSLLEEPITNNTSKNDDVVEVVKANSSEELTTDFDYDTTLEPPTQNYEDILIAGKHQQDNQDEKHNHDNNQDDKHNQEEGEHSHEVGIGEEQEQVGKPSGEDDINVEKHELDDDNVENDAREHGDVKTHEQDFVNVKEHDHDRDNVKKHVEDSDDIKKHVEDSDDIKKHAEDDGNVGKHEQDERSVEKQEQLVSDEQQQEVGGEQSAESSQEDHNVSEEEFDDYEEQDISGPEDHNQDVSTEVKEHKMSKFEDTTLEPTTTLDPQLEEAEPELVVSVVTTKSVVNNTVVPVEPPIQTVTVGTIGDNTTDTWVVVASVQTSRSVSGARYLASSNVEQDERIKLLNEEVEEVTETTTEEETTTLSPTTVRQKTSTESLIDKLDRVQSDLSSSLLSDGFNNIAVITENMSDKVVETTSPTPSTTKSSLPVVQIKKFSPLARPSTTQRSKKVEVYKQDDLTGLLPPGFKPKYQNRRTTTTTEAAVDLEEPQADEPAKETKNKTIGVLQDVSAFLPSGYKTGGKDKVDDDSTKKMKQDDGYKPPGNSSSLEKLLAKAKPVEDISFLLPPGFKLNKTNKGVEGLLAEAKPVDVSAFLPPGYKARTTSKPLTTVTEKLPFSLLPPGFKLRENPTKEPTTTTTTTSSGFKVVFPSRPGGNRKSVTRLTTSKSVPEEQARVTPPAIQKGWPSRATTEFTGWPTPSTTPISIEKLLEAARTSTSSTAPPDTTTSTTSTTTTTTTTTTPKPTTPGICSVECDLAGTIKLVDGAKWVPELLDRNTNEWQILANEVQTQLEEVFGRSNVLNKWYRKIRIDGFSEGSVLVDYLVELNDLGRQLDTIEIKKLFHDSLDDALSLPPSAREGKALNETKLEGKLSLGQFLVDPKYTDFVVLPKQSYPTVGYAEDNVLLPQWAIAVIVIGLASLLFVIIFGVTVLVNRQKNAKKKAPIPLTEDMLNELNKNHMSGFDNYGAEDLYNMEDVWNERGHDPKLAKKRSSGSLQDNSMSNLYDSWRSEWNGYYYNNYYGNNPGSSHGGPGRRRSDYDVNF